MTTQTETPTTDVVAVDVRLLDVRTGEIRSLDVATAETEELAEIVADVIAAGRDELADVEETIGAELLRRLDRRGEWTHRVGDPKTVQYELKAPSPTAGTTTYDVDELRDGLRGLVAHDVVDASAAAAALERTITVKARVPIDVDLAALKAKVADGLTEIAGVPVEDVAVDVAETAKSGGVNRLTKIGGAAAELAASVKRRGAGGARRVKVTAKRASTG